MPNNEFNVKYTNKDIMNKLEKQDKSLDRIENHAKQTNGRVSKLENVGVGMWISVHPWKFAMFAIIFSMIVISDFRQPLISFLFKLI